MDQFKSLHWTNAGLWRCWNQTDVLANIQGTSWFRDLLVLSLHHTGQLYRLLFISFSIYWFISLRNPPLLSGCPLSGQVYLVYFSMHSSLLSGCQVRFIGLFGLFVLLVYFSRLSENFLDSPETFQTVQELSRLSGNFPERQTESFNSINGLC